MAFVFMNSLLFPRWRLRKALAPSRCCVLGLAPLALIGASAHAEDPPSEPTAKALTIDATILNDTMSVVSGGMSRGTRLLARGDLRANYDGTSGALPWLSGQIDVAAINGTSISELVGDAQGVSNIEFDRTLRVVNAWAQISLTHAALKVGIIDSNLDFDEQNVGAMFIHSSHGMGPDISSAGLDGGGSAPNTTLGAIASVFDAKTGWKLRLGVFNGRPGDDQRPGQPNFAFNEDIGAMLMGEVDWTRDWGRVAVGAWHFTSRLPRLDGEGDQHHAQGGYAIIEPVLINHTDGLQLKGWLRAGLGDAMTDMVRTYLGGGMVASGFWKDHLADTIGLSVAHARMNQRASSDIRPETAIELTYQHRINGWLTVQPDVQWVIRPGGFGDIPDALVAGLRVIITKGLH